MTPLPKRKHSKARRNNRRAHDFLVPAVTVLCQNCGKPHLPHRICTNCGFYNRRSVVKIEVKDSKKK